jgi:hypothetical protein
MSSFIERFSILGTAGVLGLMVVGGIYGFASLLGVEPDESLRSLAPREVEEVSNLDGPARPVQAEVARPEATPAPPGEGSPAGPTPRPTPRPVDGPLSERPAVVLADARPGGGFGGPAAPPAATPGPAPLPTAVATPGPPPHTPPPSTPGPPTPAPAPPTPTPPPAECSTGGAPELRENGNHVRFAYGAVVLFEGGQPGVLVVDVAGTLVSLLITDGTEVRGQLGAATLASGEGRRAKDGSIIATLVEVLCPDWAR